MTNFLWLFGCAPGLELAAMLDRAAQDPRFDSDLRARFADQDADPEEAVRFFVRGTLDDDWRTRSSVSTGLEIGDLATAEASLEDVAALVDSDVERVEIARMLEPLSGPSVTETEAYKLWGFSALPAAGSAPAYSGLTGAGVIIGLVDQGLDGNHADFRAPGTCGKADCTRVISAWNASALGTPPAGFTYGAEFNQATINAGTAVMNDTEGHGTHVAGIAAGNGRATGNGQPAYSVLGMAPEADLVVTIPAPYDQSRVVDAIAYIFDVADSLGQPAVANVSLGTESGPHDGSLLFDEMLTALTGPGHLVSVAAGNYASVDRHARVPTVTSGTTATVPVYVPTYSASLYSKWFGVEGWHDLDGSYDIRVKSPSGWDSGWLAPGASNSWTTSEGRVDLANQSDATSTATKLWFYVRTSTTGANPAPGTWNLELQRHSGGADVPVDFWISYYFLGSTPKFTGSYVDRDHTLSSLATVDDMIVTGATTLERSWTSLSGGTSSLYGTCATGTCTNPVGSVADYSSRGPGRDGEGGVDVVAPGHAVASALASLVVGGTSSFTLQDGVHRIRYGTSMAAAHTTGMLALLLQDDPTLDPAAAKDLLIESAFEDSWTGAVPNNTAGYGKLRAPALVTGPDPATSLVEPVFVGTASGAGALSVLAAPFSSAGTQVVVNDADGLPIAGASVVIDFADATLAMSRTQPTGVTVDCDGGTLTATTDATGTATFKAIFGGYDNDSDVHVTAGGVYLGSMKARATDSDANGKADLGDLTEFAKAYLSAPWTVAFDFDQSGSVALGDYAIFAAEYVNGWSYTACP